MVRSIIQKKGPIRIGLSSALLLFVGFVSGCKAQDLIRPQEPFSATHKQIPGPPALNRGNQLIWIGLEPYLGQMSSNDQSRADLHLQSAGQSLVLTDSNGLVHKARQISITWREVPLVEPQWLSRQVLGPYASFESANQLALQLGKAGLPALVARPKDWEVWLPKEVELPKDFEAFAWESKINSVVQPVLKGNSGELLLSGPIQIEAPEGLRWKGGVHFGSFQLQADAYGTWTLIEKIGLESYLEGVIPHEIGVGSPFEALATQAVLARTWAVANSKRFVVDGYHLCSSTQCQVYKFPLKPSAKIKKAILQTDGQILAWDGKPINAVYHATNGGVMASASEAWSMDPVPYLRAKLDGPREWTNRFSLPIQRAELQQLLQSRDQPYGNYHPRFRWERMVTALGLQKQLSSIEPKISLPAEINVLQRGRSGRVVALEIKGAIDQSSVVLNRDAIRRNIPNLPSTLFVVNQISEGMWQFSGGGFGHGAGLSQAGAIDLARKGWSYLQILSHYYPGTIFGPLPDSDKDP